MIDPKYIGRQYPEAAYEIGKEKTKEFAIAVGDLNPLYIDEAEARKSHYGGLIAPPMFAVVYAREPVSKVLFDGDLALNLMMLVHGEQEFEFREVVKCGDVIRTTGKIVDVYQKKATLDFLVFETVSKNQRGNVVCVGKWTFVIRA